MVADARRHVNKMCLASDIPLIESGTAGYVGQVQPIKRGITECYDCQGIFPFHRLPLLLPLKLKIDQENPLPRHLRCVQFEVLLQQLIIVFPGPKVISFRESQSDASHVLSLSNIVNHSQLFGADDEADGQDLDEAEKNGENGEFLILSNQESTTNCIN